MKPFIYLDNCASTKVRQEVLETMLPFLTEHWGNASSIHLAGRRARAAIEQAREQVASMIGAQPSEIFFTPSATLSNNAAILGRARFVEEKGWGRHVITSCVEHSSALAPVKHLKSRGWRVTTLPVNREGLVDIDRLKAAITSDTSIISVMWANNEVGTIQPVHAIAEIAAEKGIFFHSDAVQAAGKIKIDLSTTAIQSLSLSGHKFHAPKGIGVHYLRQGNKILPVNFGGGQENGLVPGTENIANIAAIGQAAELAVNELKTNGRHLRHLSAVLINRLLCLPEIKLTGPAELQQRLPGHVSVVVPNKIGKDIVEQADRDRLYISSAAACSSGSAGVSHVLRAMGLSEQESFGALRISAGIFNTEEECIVAANILARIINDSSNRLIA